MYARAKNGSAREALTAWLPPALVLAGVWTLWEVAYYQGWLRLGYFPAPSKVLEYVVEQDFALGLGHERSNVSKSILFSFFRVLSGLALAFASAVISGAFIASVRPASRTLLPLVRLVAPIAPIAWISLALVIFGIGNSAAVFLVFMGTYPILVIATVSAIQQVDPELLQTASALGASRFRRWIHVVVPAALPSVFTILRINFIAAWMAVLAAEMVGLRDGLGALILLGRESSSPELTLAGMGLIAISGFAIDQTLVFIQRHFLWWNKDVTI